MPRTTPCTPEQAKARLSQAQAFIDVADLVLDEPSTRPETHVAAALAVLAAIAASDAICGLRAAGAAGCPVRVRGFYFFVCG
jgi:hypothetical protein